MHPDKARRETTEELTDLPNVGPSMAGILRELGIEKPSDLIGADAFGLYERLNRSPGVRLDPCVLDVLMSVVDFMNGGAAKVWWHYTAERKRRLGG